MKFFEFLKFYNKATRKKYIKNPLIRGLKDFFIFYSIFNCINNLNKKFEINITIDEIKHFNQLKNLCDEWKNEQINYLLQYFLRKKK